MVDFLDLLALTLCVVYGTVGGLIIGGFVIGVLTQGKARDGK